MEPYTKPFQMPFIYQETDLELQMPDQSTRFLYIFNENWLMQESFSLKHDCIVITRWFAIRK